MSTEQLYLVMIRETRIILGWLSNITNHRG